jgi:hypothetical protein
MASVQVAAIPKLWQSPPQPVKIEKGSALAVKVTDVLGGYAPAQSLAHTVPPAVPLTVPVPLPGFIRLRANVFRVNVALAVCACVSVTVQVPVLFVQAPLQPVNSESLPGLAVSTTDVLIGYVPAQFVAHGVPPAEPVTVPLPVVFTVSANVFTTVNDTLAIWVCPPPSL